MEKIVVLDAGGQYCHLIARRLRHMGIYADVKPSSAPKASLADYRGVIISGGPRSVYERNRPDVDPGVFELGVPILGICYGHQLIAQHLGGDVMRGSTAEYGIADLSVQTKDSLFKHLPAKQKVWMSHRDLVTKVPNGFEKLATTQSCPVAAMGDHIRRFYGVQFHPEVAHTEKGNQILTAFVQNICGCALGVWQPAREVEKILHDIRLRVGSRKVLFFVSGGVDSSVAFALCAAALGAKKVEGVFVDTGFMRDIDVEDVRALAAMVDSKIRIIPAQNDFLKLVGRTYSPEKKRKLIGEKFVEIHERVLREHFSHDQGDWVLGQGTIYPDTIESGGTKDASTIKTHHNRVSAICQMIEAGLVVEPLSQFYKDEVRAIGYALNVEKRLIEKQPFPGPGLAIRCITSSRDRSPLNDEIVTKFAGAKGLQGMKVPLRTVGVKGDARSYQSIAIIAGEATYSELQEVSTDITNHTVDVTRVLYHIGTGAFNSDDWLVRRRQVNKDRVALLRRADTIVRDLMTQRYSSEWAGIWQFPVILIPLFDLSTRTESIVLRPVNSIDGMTASFSQVSKTAINFLADALTKELKLNVFLDITNKPPATIEWE
jgi:GMP synthase (glutamine-hydrolysing)